jgi:hypothetical protein
MIHVHPPRREPSGRRQRPVGALAQQIDRERREAERQSAQAVALAQPHRRGSDDPLCESPFGKFVLDKKLRRELVQAADHYADLVRLWRVAKGIPTDMNLSAGGSGDGPSTKTVRAWEREIEVIETALRSCGWRSYLAVRHLVIDRRELPDEEADCVKAGLRAVALALGMIGREHPFRP